MVLKAAWNWGSNSSVINDPIGEPDHTPLYVDLLSAWVYIQCPYVFPHLRGRAP